MDRYNCSLPAQYWPLPELNYISNFTTFDHRHFGMLIPQTSHGYYFTKHLPVRKWKPRNLRDFPKNSKQVNRKILVIFFFNACHKWSPLLWNPTACGRSCGTSSHGTYFIPPLFSVGLPSTLKVKPLGAGTASQAPRSAWGGTSYRAAAVISFSINKHNTRRRSWNADKNTEWMWVRTVMNKQRFKRQDTCLEVSLLSDACLGGTWFHQWSNTDLVTRRALGSPSAPSSMVHKDKQVWPHPV